MDEIRINNLSYTYINEVRNTQVQALKNVSLSLKRGMRIMVCGKNGAGKSTLLNIIAGKKMIKEHEVMIFNRPSFHDTSLSECISFVGEWWNDDFIINITIKNLFKQYNNSKRYRRLLKLFDIDEHKFIAGLSKGEKKKTQIIANLIKRKDVYIFDEVTESLDLISRKLLLEFLKKECIKYNSIVIYSTHIFDHMEQWCSHVLFISNGSINCFSDVNQIIQSTKGGRLIEYIFNKMTMELKEKEQIEDLDDLIVVDSD